MFPNNKPADTARHWILRRDRRLSKRTTKQSRKWERKIIFSDVTDFSLAVLNLQFVRESKSVDDVVILFEPIVDGKKRQTLLASINFMSSLPVSTWYLTVIMLLLLFWLALRCCARYLRYYISSSVRQIHKFFAFHLTLVRYGILSQKKNTALFLSFFFAPIAVRMWKIRVHKSTAADESSGRKQNIH